MSFETPPPPSRGAALRWARARRVRSLRRRVAAGSVALFVAVWLLIAVVMATGHDPVLARTAATVASTSKTSTSGTASASSSTRSASTTSTTPSSGTTSSASSSGLSAGTTSQS